MAERFQNPPGVAVYSRPLEPIRARQRRLYPKFLWPGLLASFFINLSYWCLNFPGPFGKAVFYSLLLFFAASMAALGVTAEGVSAATAAERTVFAAHLVWFALAACFEAAFVQVVLGPDAQADPLRIGPLFTATVGKVLEIMAAGGAIGALIARAGSDAIKAPIDVSEDVKVAFVHKELLSNGDTLATLEITSSKLPHRLRWQGSEAAHLTEGADLRITARVWPDGWWQYACITRIR